MQVLQTQLVPPPLVRAVFDLKNVHVFIFIHEFLDLVTLNFDEVSQLPLTLQGIPKFLNHESKLLYLTNILNVDLVNFLPASTINLLYQTRHLFLICQEQF